MSELRVLDCLQQRANLLLELLVIHHYYLFLAMRIYLIGHSSVLYVTVEAILIYYLFESITVLTSALQLIPSMEYQINFLSISPPIHHAVDLPATHHSSSNLFKPDSSIFYINQPMRVSEKLLQNKIRKLEIEQKQHQEKQSLLERRRRREKQIHLFELKREALVQQQRQAGLRSNRNELSQKLNNEEDKRVERVHQMQASQAMIDLCRKRVEEKKQEYIIRIQNKTRERQQRAQRKRQMIERATEKTNDEIHMEEWKNYEASILKKHQNEILKPDRLYQEYKMKNNQLKNLFEAKSKQNRQAVTPQPYTTHTKPNPQFAGSTRIQTGQPFFKATRRTEFYGVHEEDMVKKTLKDMSKMRSFIEEHTILSDPSKKQGFMDKFQQYLLKQILR